MGATGAGVPIPSRAKRANALSSATTAAPSSSAPAARSGQGQERDSHPVSSHGTRPATVPGATTRNSALPMAALRPDTGSASHLREHLGH